MFVKLSWPSDESGNKNGKQQACGVMRWRIGGG